jgi:hypothetical protein
VTRLRLFWTLISCCFVDLSDLRAQTPPQPAAAQLKVFLDCQAQDCFSDYLRTELPFVDFVRDRSEAEVHVLITRAETGSGGQEYAIAFIGSERFKGTDQTLKALTSQSDSEDMIRRQLATSLRIGLLNYLSQAGVPQGLDVDVRLGTEAQRPALVGDRWSNWVFSVRGSAALESEESTRQTEVGLGISADRITPDWKITLGAELDYESEEFDLDEDEPVKVDRRERDLEALVVNGLGEHWSIGAQGETESSTFENIKFSIGGAPAIEFNVFPYSAYTRRQLRALYAVGARHNRYYETTLYGKTEETLPQHEISLTYEQREQWGSLEARTEWNQYLNDFDKYRLEVDGALAVRVARGLSVEGRISGSRVRDQISLPARDATPEEILLRLRELESGYQFNIQVSVTYTFGSIFSSVVNPRFGQ